MEYSSIKLPIFTITNHYAMIVKKNLSIKDIFKFSGQHLIWLVPWMLIVTSVYYFTHWKFITIPWLPLSLIGTAVAFYIGFKNNQAYNRVWEARRIWGGMVNDSRKFASMIRNYRIAENNPTEKEEGLQRKEIIFRHIAWLYQLRSQLLIPTKWEHVSLKWVYGFYNQKRRDHLFNDFKDELKEITEQHYLSEEELKSLGTFNNKAVRLLDAQTEAIQKLYASGKINTMQQTDLQAVVNSFFDEQGKAERIKNFPFPRNYASHGFVFTCIFIFLLPLGIVGELAKLGDGMIWLSVPVGVIVGWIYVVLELIGDYSENPFEGLNNDIPMLSICRTIEIDLLQMLGESQVPKPIQSKNGVLL
jgi:putative membrane protein